ncbi:MAG: DUF177 domain-containing protein [Desulfobacca sp.]|nr:DUF177 domain-containing protein [Desulfobacca sp.]
MISPKLLTIPIERIPAEGLDLPVLLGAEWMAHWREREPGLEFSLESTLSGTIHLEKVDGYILVRGLLKGELRLNCSRCLESFLEPLECRFELVLRPGPPVVAAEEVELTREELDEDFYSGEELDLEGIVQEQLLLAVPVKPLCQEDCLGLCPFCGANLNRETCSCHRGKFNQPFALLSKLTKTSK